VWGYMSVSPTDVSFLVKHFSDKRRLALISVTCLQYRQTLLKLIEVCTPYFALEYL